MFPFRKVLTASTESPASLGVVAATEYHLGLLKAKLAKYRAQLLEPSKSPAAKGEGFDVMKSGDARVALIGFPSVGKVSACLWSLGLSRLCFAGQVRGHRTLEWVGRHLQAHFCGVLGTVLASPAPWNCWSVETG